jgi:citrate synthase
LLIYGELPTSAQLDTFRESIRRHTMLHEDMKSFYNGFPREAHPMAILSSVVSALSTFYQDSLNPHDPQQVEVSTHRLLAKLPTIAAYSYKKSVGQPFIYPQNNLSYCENFLQMMFAVPSEPYELDPDFVEALNLLLIVHADHEQNCSTSTVRMVGSSNANLFASISAGISALWGPLHGGANEAVVDMLEQIINDGSNVKKYVDMAKDKKSGFRLMGFGHRVYKNYDPRAKIIKGACDKLLAKLAHLRSPVRRRTATRGSRPERPLLSSRKALSQRRFLFGRDLPGDRNPGADVHRSVCHWPAARLAGPLDRDAPVRNEADLPAATDLRRSGKTGHHSARPSGSNDNRSRSAHA